MKTQKQNKETFKVYPFGSGSIYKPKFDDPTIIVSFFKDGKRFPYKEVTKKLGLNGVTEINSTKFCNSFTKAVWVASQAREALESAREKIKSDASTHPEYIASRKRYWDDHCFLQYSSQRLVRSDWSGRMEYVGPFDILLGEVPINLALQHREAVAKAQDAFATCLE